MGRSTSHEAECLKHDAEELQRFPARIGAGTFAELRAQASITQPHTIIFSNKLRILRPVTDLL